MELIWDGQDGENPGLHIRWPKMTLKNVSLRSNSLSVIPSANPAYRSTCMKNIILFLLGFLVILTDCSSRNSLFDSEGPNSFTHEPPRFNYFTNDKGLLLYCSARGSPKPSITWMSGSTGDPLASINGLRQILENGSIHYPPFSMSFFRPEVHNTTIYCQAGNLGGQIRSRDIVIRAVINSRHEIQLDDAFTTLGNDALLKCLIPEAIKDFVSVTSWIKDSTFNIFPHAGGGGGRYIMLPSGELLIEGTISNDSTSTFQCRTVNRLTGKTLESQTLARLMLRGEDRDGEPRILSGGISQLRWKEGETGVLVCLSEGWPPPGQWWSKDDGFGGFGSLRQTDRIRIRKSSVIIENVGVQDGGIYVCNSTNRYGSVHQQIHVRIQSPLAVQVLPTVLTADIGKIAEFSCWTNMGGDSMLPGNGIRSLSSLKDNIGLTTRTVRDTLRIRWFRNGKELMPSARIAFSPSGDKLRISYVQREDMGMIQCLVTTETDMGQATSQLRLGEASPHFIYRFIEQTLQPGQAISLKCAAAGNPTPRVIWMLDGFIPPISERLLIGQYVTMSGDVVSHLNITKTKVEDGGEYSCTVNNTHGTLTHSARLNIYGPPVIRSMPLITAVAGKILTIKCPAAGFPLEWPILWEKDNQHLPLSRRQTVSPDGILTIRDVDRSADVGTYACTARNKQGLSDKKSVQVQVVVAPKVSFEFPASVSMGERLVVNCYVSEGDSPIEIKWLKDSRAIVAETSADMGGKTVSTTRGDFDLTLRINPVSFRDSGEYTCSATNRYGEARRSAKLVVRVPPRITPFSFPTSVQLHQRAQVVCALQEGESFTTSLRWYKNGEPLASGGADHESRNVKIIEVQRAVSLLIIDGADSRDNGNYTCEARSDIEGLSDAVTAAIVVRVPPKWLVEPKDQYHVLSGDVLRIPCQATGFPVPTISWKKQMGRAGSYHDISVQQGLSGKGANEDILSDSNGTLFIRNANKAHQGTYLCEGSNGIGSDLSKVVRIIVNAPVKIQVADVNVTVRVRSNAVLQCHINGDSPIDVAWRRSHSDTNIVLDPRYFFQTINGSNGGLISELKINNVVRGDSGRYLCHASNPFGKDHTNLWLLVKDVPEAPRDLYVMANGSRFVRLGWTLETSLFGNSPITQFIIKYTEGNPEESWGDLSAGLLHYSELSVPGDSYSETVNNLKPATLYYFTIFARNEIGTSTPSKRLEVTTNGEPPGPPSNIEVVTISSSELRVLWDQPLGLDDKSLLGYYVGFRRQREEEQYQFSAIDTKGLQNSQRLLIGSIPHSSLTPKNKNPRGEHFIRNLVPFTTYDIVMQAFNVYGVGELSPAVGATTAEDVPISAPEGLTCVAMSSQSIKMSFLPLSPTLARGQVTGYKIYLELVDSNEFDDEVLVRSTSTTSMIVNGLQPWTNYSVQVSGLTRIGEGVLGSPMTCQTDEDVPGKLEAIKVVANSGTSVFISWLPPKKRSGHLLNYVLYIYDTNGVHGSARGSPIKKRNISAQKSYHEIDSLKTNERYEFRISAVSSKGEGKPIVMQLALSKKNGAAVVTIGQHFYLLWKSDISLPCKSVGDPLPYVTWSRSGVEIKESDRYFLKSDGSLLIRELRKEDEAVYTCSVVNDHGEDAINHTLHVQVPPSAPSLQHGPVSHSSIWISWKLGEVDKSSPVKGYILHVKGREEWIEKKLSRHINTYELTDLECGTSYQLYLTGYNVAGTGKGSNILKNLTTLGGPPTLSPPTPDMMLQVNVTWVRIKLDSWSDNGCPLKQCRVLYRIQDHHAKWQTVGAEMSAKTYFVDLTGLKPSTSYTVRVICQNSAGENEAVLSLKTLSSKEHTLSEHMEDPLSKSPIWKNVSPAATTSSTAFYMDWKLMGPIIISSVAILVAATGVCLCMKKKPESMGRSLEHLSGCTPSSSTYFKGNQRQNHQIYMTVKKATPVKGQEIPEHIPQYAEDIYPYATFELNDSNRRETRFNGVPTTALERSRANSSSSRSRKHDRHAENYYKSTYNPYGNPPKADESEEYDSIDSDSDIGTTRERPGEFFIEYREPMEKKSQDFDPHVRGSNHYEFVPLSNHLFHNPFLKNPENPKDKHPLPNCDGAGSGYKSGSKQFSRTQKNKTGGKYNPHPYVGGANKPFHPNQIEPPLGFGDKYQTPHDPSGGTGSSTAEFAIAV